MTRPAGNPDFPDDRQNNVLRGDAFRPLPVHQDMERLRPRLHQALRGEHVFYFARANPKRQRAKRAMRGRMAVAANNRLTRLRDAQFRADNVHDALVAAVHVEQTHAGFAAVLL